MSGLLGAHPPAPPASPRLTRHVYNVTIHTAQREGGKGADGQDQAKRMVRCTYRAGLGVAGRAAGRASRLGKLG